MSHDELWELLNAADPVRPDRPLPPLRTPLPDLMEAIVTDSDTALLDPPRRGWWAPAAAAAVVLALAVGALLALTGSDKQQVAKTVTTLSVNPDAAMQMCMVFSVETLGGMPLAFSGTAAAVDGGVVTLDVDRWYRGGTADQVRITAPAADTVALLGAVEFKPGGRYLVTATDGVVNACGYTAEWSAEMAAHFEAAFR